MTEVQERWELAQTPEDQAPAMYFVACQQILREYAPKLMVVYHDGNIQIINRRGAIYFEGTPRDSYIWCCGLWQAKLMEAGS